MPIIELELKNIDDAHVEDTWRIYHAFVGRYYQRPVDSQAGFYMLKDYPGAWEIHLEPEQLHDLQNIAFKCAVFNALFRHKVLP